MEISDNSHGGSKSDALSPKITQYFTRSKLKNVQGTSETPKAKLQNQQQTLVYLTPESSPGNDLHSEVMKEAGDMSQVRNMEETSFWKSTNDNGRVENANNDTETESETVKENGMTALQGVRDDTKYISDDAVSMSSNSSVTGSDNLHSANALSDADDIISERFKPECLHSEINENSIDQNIILTSKGESMQISNLDNASTSPVSPEKPTSSLPRQLINAEPQISSTSNHTQSKDSVPANSASVSQVSTEASKTSTSSPSLPRPKVLKGAKSKSKNNALPTAEAAQLTKPKAGRKKKKDAEPAQKSVITDFFPVRRSERRPKAEVEKEKRHHLEQMILTKCENGLEVREFENKGRGVVATKDFDKGDFVVEYAGELIALGEAKEREKEYGLKPDIGCYMYFFACGDKRYCVDATAESGRLGRLINHSREGNCCTKAVIVNDIPRLILVASRDIKMGEELSYDYGDRSKEALEAHPWLKS